MEESVYNARGLAVATRIGSGPWTCMSYDARSRAISTNVPAHGAEPVRTVTYNHKVLGNPLVASAGDAAGTVSTKVELMGRIVSHTDAWTKTTTSPTTPRAAWSAPPVQFPSIDFLTGRARES